MRLRSSSLGPLALALGLATGCGGGDNTLSGSIGMTHSLGFDSVTLRQVATSYVVAYLRGSETIARVSYTPKAGMTITPSQSLPLDFGGTGNPGNAGLSRAAADRLSFPPPKGGTWTFTQAATVGAEVSGRFGIEFTSGQTLSGTFLATLEQALP